MTPKKLAKKWKNRQLFGVKIIVHQICKISAALSNQKKPVAKEQGQNLKWLLNIIIPINVGNNCCPEWILI